MMLVPVGVCSNFVLIVVMCFGFFFFFFQAEDGIRDRDVTGVQTCALPIYGLDGSVCVCPRLRDVPRSAGIIGRRTIRCSQLCARHPPDASLALRALRRFRLHPLSRLSEKKAAPAESVFLSDVTTSCGNNV